MEYLFSAWKKADISVLKSDTTLYVTHGEDCDMCAVEDGTLVVGRVEELCREHEESDTRMFLHAQHAMLESYENVLIRSPDTDVALIGNSLKSQLLVNLFFFTGVGNRTRIIYLQAIIVSLGPQLSEALIGFHTFTGCDSTSAFYGKGKKKAVAVA